MAAFAVRPHRLTAARVTGNDLPPLRLKPNVPLPSHRLPSLWFQKTTRLTDVQRRFFAGRTPLSRKPRAGVRSPAPGLDTPVPVGKLWWTPKTGQVP